MAGTRLFVIISFILPILLLSPIAYNMIKVNRSDLPLNKMSILSLNNDQHVAPFVIPIQLIYLNSAGVTIKPPIDVDLSLKNSSLIEFQITRQSMKIPSYFTKINKIKETSDETVDELAEHDDLLKRFGTDEIESFNASYVFFFVCDTAQDNNSSWIVGKYRHGWIHHCFDTKTTIPTSQDAMDVLTFLLTNVLAPSPVTTTTTSVAARVALSYRLSFSLLNENPTNYGAQWDFKRIASHYLAPFLEKVSTLASFTVDSQIISFGQLSKVVHQSTSLRCVSLRELQQFESANDYYATGLLSDREPHLEFITFVANPNASTFLIQPETHLSRSSNNDFDDTCDLSSAVTAFAIPGWGGVAVVSPIPSFHDLLSAHDLSNVSTSFAMTDQELTVPMAFFISHLRQLLGAPLGAVGTAAPSLSFLDTPSSLSVLLSMVQTLPSTTDGMTDWELDVLSRAWIYRHTTTATQTLMSIAKLVSDMPHMSVMDRIQTNVEAALLSLKAATENYTINTNSTSPRMTISQKSSLPSPLDNYRVRLLHLRNAVSFADAAYYDPTMVPQLYFPQEHLYAVFVPLLLPLLLPLILGFKREMARFKKKKRAATTLK